MRSVLVGKRKTYFNVRLLPISVLNAIILQVVYRIESSLIYKKEQND